MNPIAEKITDWKTKRKIERARAALNTLILAKDQDTYREIHKLITPLATQMAMQMMMAWLDKKGLNHCKFCPEPGTLYRYGDHYLCENHLAGTKGILKVGADGLREGARVPIKDPAAIHLGVR